MNVGAHRGKQVAVGQEGDGALAAQRLLHVVVDLLAVHLIGGGTARIQPLVHLGVGVLEHIGRGVGVEGAVEIVVGVHAAAVDGHEGGEVGGAPVGHEFADFLHVERYLEAGLLQLGLHDLGRVLGHRLRQHIDGDGQRHRDARLFQQGLGLVRVGHVAGNLAVGNGPVRQHRRQRRRY